MTIKVVSVADAQAAADVLARYCWYFDDGDVAGYLSLWTGEGEMTGFGEPIRGRESLAKLVEGNYGKTQGKQRHVLTNVTQQYGDSKDTLTAKGYNLVVNWGAGGGSLMVNVKETFELRRTEDGWRLTRVHLDLVQ